MIRLKDKDRIEMLPFGEEGEVAKPKDTPVKTPEPSSTTSANTYWDQALEMLKKQPTASYTPGNYQAKYTDQVDSIINEILNSKYQGYDPTTDPTYSQYKKTYLREADRTAEDVLGKYAAMNGGMASTAAISAASQAGNNFKGQLADKIPELEAAAYDRYLAELSGKRQNLSDLISAEDLAYSLWQGEEAQKKAAYDQEQNAYDTALNRLLQGAEIAQGKEDSEASKALSQLGYGVMPSEAGLKALGIDAATAKSLMAASEGAGLSEETALALLKLSIENGTTPSAELLNYFGLSQGWGNNAVHNSVASANGQDMTAGGDIDMIKQELGKYSNDRGKEIYLQTMVDRGIITDEEAAELYIEYSGEYGSDSGDGNESKTEAADIPLQDREWAFEDGGGNNWGGGIDNNAKVKDQFGNVYRMDDLYEAMKKAGLSDKEAEAYALLIQAKTGVVKS